MRFRRTKVSNNYDHIVGFFWDKKNRNFYIAFWRLVYVLEYPQKIRMFGEPVVGETRYVDGKTLGVKLEVNDNEQPQAMNAGDFDITYTPADHETGFLSGGKIPDRPVEKVEREKGLYCDKVFSDKEIEDLRAAWNKPDNAKIVLIAKEEIAKAYKHKEQAYTGPLPHIVHSALCGPVEQDVLDRAKARGEILHGWTGLKCGECNGSGEDQHCGKCVPCGGTGDEYGELKVKMAVPYVQCTICKGARNRYIQDLSSGTWKTITCSGCNGTGNALAKVVK